MSNLRMLFMSVMLVLLVVAVTRQDMEILARPIRPEKFTNQRELQDYLSKVKAYLLQNGQRYGKRFSPSLPFHPRFRAKKWQIMEKFLNRYDN